MISLSSIVKSGSFHVYADSQKQANDWIKKKDRPHGELDKTNEAMLEQALRKSRHIYDEAKKRAEDIIEDAKKEVANIRIKAEQGGYQEGYTKGLTDGEDKARIAAERSLGEIADLIAAINEEKARAIASQKEDILDLSFELAKKIMRQHMKLDENALANMLDDLISENEGGVRIYLSEYSKTLDLRMDKGLVQKLRKEAGNVKVSLIQHDDIIMVETENGMVDASIPVQLKQLHESIKSQQRKI